MGNPYLFDVNGCELAEVREFFRVYFDGAPAFVVMAETDAPPAVGADLAVKDRETGEVLARLICQRAMRWNGGTVRITGRSS